jgi:transcription initiation factor TFIIB
LPEKTKRFAIKILKKAEIQQIMAGKDPMGMAASALYIAGLETGNSITQRVMAEASGVTEVTIRNRCKSLKAIVD